MQTTKPAQAHEDNFPTARHIAHVTPLARAALDNGIAFEDVQAYCLAKAERCVGLFDALCSLDSDSGFFDDVRGDVLLDGALARSVLAQGTIEHARLWWRGVL